MNLIHGNCLTEMATIGDNTVDMVLTSPPYNMNLRVRNGKYVSRQITEELTTKYTNYDDNLPMDAYFNMLKTVVNESLRVSDLLFLNIQQVTGNKPALYKMMGEFHDKIKETIIWNKVNAEPAIGSNVLNSQYEFIIVFQNSKPFNRSFDICNFERGTFSNVINMKKERQPMKGLKAAFPLELAKTLITNFSNEGGVILDPFMGSGTTGVAAVETNRDFIGIELDETTFKFAQNRINASTTLVWD